MRFDQAVNARNPRRPPGSSRERQGRLAVVRRGDQQGGGILQPRLAVRGVLPDIVVEIAGHRPEARPPQRLAGGGGPAADRERNFFDRLTADRGTFNPFTDAGWAVLRRRFAEMIRPGRVKIQFIVNGNGSQSVSTSPVSAWMPSLT